MGKQPIQQRIDAQCKRIDNALRECDRYAGGDTPTALKFARRSLRAKERHLKNLITLRDKWGVK